MNICLFNQQIPQGAKNNINEGSYILRYLWNLFWPKLCGSGQLCAFLRYTVCKTRGTPYDLSIYQNINVYVNHLWIGVYFSNSGRRVCFNSVLHVKVLWYVFRQLDVDPDMWLRPIKAVWLIILELQSILLSLCVTKFKYVVYQWPVQVDVFLQNEFNVFV